MADNPLSWGILGNPSQAEVERWKNLPAGDFKKMVKELSKKSKNKKSLKEHTIFVTKKVSNMFKGTAKVQAFDAKHALDLAMRSKDIQWDDNPYKSDHVEYVYSSIDPTTRYK